MVRKLTELGIIGTEKGGCYLTDKGKELVDEFLRVVVPPTEIKLRLTGESYVSVIRTVSRPVDVIKMRDHVVRHGGSGALILLMTETGLVFPESGEPLSRYSEEDEVTLLKELDLKNGDLILVGMGRSGPSLAHSVLSAVVACLKEICQ